MKRIISEKGKMIALGFGTTNFKAFCKGDGKTIYFVSEDGSNKKQYEKMLEASIKNEKGKKLKVSGTGQGDLLNLLRNNLGEKKKQYFEPAIRTELTVDWDEDSKYKGKNQCPPQDIDGKSVLACYNTRLDTLSEGESIKSLISLKSRLDALDIPYALGTDHFESGKIVIKVRVSDIKKSEIMLLPVYGTMNITNGYAECSTGLNGIYKQKKTQLAVKLSSKEDAEKISAQNKKYGFKKVYLECGSIPLAYISAKDFENQISQDHLTFKKYCTEGIGDGKEETVHHSDYIVSVSKNDLYLGMDLFQFEMHDENDDYSGMGNYGSFRHSNYTSEEKLVDKIAKELKKEGIKAYCIFSGSELDLKLEKKNCATNIFEKNVSRCISKIFDTYSFYNNNVRLKTIRCTFSNEAGKKSGDKNKEVTLSFYINYDYDTKAVESYKYKTSIVEAAVFTSDDRVIKDKEESAKFEKKLEKELKEYYPLSGDKKD